ncbi:hypothetical protein TKK_0013687 [Trichogramma kaykai]
MSESDIVSVVKNVEFDLSRVDVDDYIKENIRERIASSNKYHRNKYERIDETVIATQETVKSARLFLKSHPDIFFTNSDKGNETVCLEKSEFIRSMKEMLSDAKTYR